MVNRNGWNRDFVVTKPRPLSISFSQFAFVCSASLFQALENLRVMKPVGSVYRGAVSTKSDMRVVCEGGFSITPPSRTTDHRGPLNEYSITFMEKTKKRKLDEQWYDVALLLRLPTSMISDLEKHLNTEGTAPCKILSFNGKVLGYEVMDEEDDAPEDGAVEEDSLDEEEAQFMGFRTAAELKKEYDAKKTRKLRELDPAVKDPKTPDTMDLT